jgi:hypothetical protein
MDAERTSKRETRVGRNLAGRASFRWTVSRSVRDIQIQKRQKGKRGRTVGDEYHVWNGEEEVGRSEVSGMLRMASQPNLLFW